MINKPTVSVFGGVNGAGKSSLYEVLSHTEKLGQHINVDDIVKELGSWQDRFLHLKAARIAKALIDECIENGTSFHFESTLTGKSVNRQLEKARLHGFQTVMYFVGIDSLDTAIERVRKRVENGGHGIEDRAIATRFRAMPANLLRILPCCDEIYFYDNTVRFRQIAVHHNGVVLDEDPILPEWYINIFHGNTIKSQQSGNPLTDS